MKMNDEIEMNTLKSEVEHHEIKMIQKDKQQLDKKGVSPPEYEDE